MTTRWPAPAVRGVQYAGHFGGNNLEEQLLALICRILPLLKHAINFVSDPVETNEVTASTSTITLDIDRVKFILNRLNKG